MEDLKSILDTSLQWEYKKRKSFLKSDDEIILQLKEGKKKQSFFILEDKKYTIRNRGFWNPRTTIEQDKKTIVSLRRPFRSYKTFIEFENGNSYSCKTRNAVLVKFSIYDANQKEILNYKLTSRIKFISQLVLANKDIPATDLIFLIVLGSFVFKGIVRESVA